jgi:hypothetical protein
LASVTARASLRLSASVVHDDSAKLCIVTDPLIRDTGPVDLPLFHEVADALHGMVPGDLGTLRTRARTYDIKVWFDAEAPPREHYEAQVVSPDASRPAKVLALEIGFHAEHPKREDNDAVIAQLTRRESRWRAKLGKEAVVGPFLGRADLWRRVSETWPDPDLSDPELAVEIAARLTDYVTALEPVRRATGRKRTR